MSTPGLVEHFFRHEYGRLVASLSRRVGLHHIESVEDAVQAALATALEAWTRSSAVPGNPSAWLFRVAHNNLIDTLRRSQGRQRILAEHSSELKSHEDGPDALLAGEVRDDLLRMLFVACDSTIPTTSQLVFALKILCGFDVGEIAQRLFISEANVYKRLTRARNALRDRVTQAPDVEQDPQRLAAVHHVLYLIFTEGYLSSRAEMAIRKELCNEALRLATIVSESAIGQTPETRALLALMHLHMARLESRHDESGGLLLLEEQRRELWDQQHIRIGLWWLAKSAEGEVFSRYHAEAGIAAEHCLARSFAETRWQKVADCYALLESIAPSPLHRLNRAVAVAEWRGPQAGLAVVEGFEPPSWLAGSYMWSAVLADLQRRCGNVTAAEEHRDAALRLAPTPEIKTLLARRLSAKI